MTCCTVAMDFTLGMVALAHVALHRFLSQRRTQKQFAILPTFARSCTQDNIVITLAIRGSINETIGDAS